MSTGYSVVDVQAIPVAELLGGRLARYGICEAQSQTATDHARCLTDGLENFLWCYGSPVTHFARYFPNGHPGFILRSIATEFDVEIYCTDDQTEVDPERATAGAAF